MERQEPVKINNQKSSFDDAAVKKRSKGISKEKYQMKLAYEALKKENDAKIAKMEKEAKDKHDRGKWTGLLKGALMGAGGVGLTALTGGAAAPLSAYLLAGGLGAAGGYMDASTGSDIMPTGMAMMKMKMAADLAAKDPRNNYKMTPPTATTTPTQSFSRDSGLDFDQNFQLSQPASGGLTVPSGQPQPTAAELQQSEFKKNLANLMAIRTNNTQPIPGPGNNWGNPPVRPL